MGSAYCLNQDLQDYGHFLIDNYPLQNYQSILYKLCDSTQRLKAWASVSSRLRFSRRVHRLTVAPPAGISLWIP